MSSDDRLANLMFLLSFPPLAVGCSVGGVSTTSSSGPPVVDPTTGGDDDDDDDDDTASAETAAADTSTSTGGVDVDDGPSMTDDDGPSMTDDGPYTGTTGGYECEGMPPMVAMISPLCVQYVAHFNDCYYGGMQPPYCVAIYEAYCQSYIDTSGMKYGPYCVYAIQEAYSCISQIPCLQLMDMTPDCVEEYMFLNAVCTD